MITLCIPTYNRFTSVEKIISENHTNKDITEIIIVDDCSSDFISSDLKFLEEKYFKVKYFKNDKNLGPFGNKKRTVELSNNDWVFLCDSDNFIDKKCFDEIKKHFEWDRYTIYAPSKSSLLDYGVLSGRKFTGNNDLKELVNIGIGEVFLNTGNFFFHKDEYIKAAKRTDDKYKIFGTKNPYDVFYLTIEWLLGGNTIFCVPNFYYYHHVSRDSIWNEQNKNYKNAYDCLINSIK